MDLPAINVLSLAAGAGGLDLGLRLALPRARLVCAVEIEAYACEILASRMEEGALDPAPIWTDLRTFAGEPWRGVVDILTAGYPCQPFSVAGKQRGVDDPRHLWPHVARVIRECEPGLVFIENVANHLNIGFEEVRAELQGMGYRVEAGLFAAAEVGAPHRRARLFALAHHHHDGQYWLWGGGLRSGEQYGSAPRAGSDTDRCSGEGIRGCEYPESADVGHASSQSKREPRYEGLRTKGWQEPVGTGGGLGDPDSAGLEGRGVRGVGSPDERAPWPPGPTDTVGWEQYLADRPGLEPSVRGGSDGLACRMDRLRLTGNGVVPDQAAYAFLTLLDSLNR